MLQLPPLSLYIHLPWCERKCPYCDFNSHELNPHNAGGLPERDYIRALLRDLEHDLPAVQGRAVDTLFIGGGTPSLFSVAGVRALLNGVRERVVLAEDAEITLEANPGSAEAEKFAGFVDAGVNRISLGVQSLHDDCLRALGRVHDREQALAAATLLAGCGLRSYNLDLMHGLPGQTAATARADLTAAIGTGAPHLSWYQLTIEPNTRFHTHPPTLPTEAALGDIQRAGEQALTGAGYGCYEVSAWARPDHRCRHNLNYWGFGDYIGIGAGAHGKLSFPAESRVLRAARRRQPREYLQDGGTGPAREWQLNRGDLIGEYLMNALRLTEGFGLGDFEARTGVARKAIDARLDDLVEQGLLRRDGERVRTTSLGRRYLDSMLAEFF